MSEKFYGFYGQSDLEEVVDLQRKWNGLSLEEQVAAVKAGYEAGLLLFEGRVFQNFQKEAIVAQKAAAPETPPQVQQDPLAGLVVGRMVYYHPRPHEAKNCAPGPWASVVTALGELPGEVTLNVHMPAPAMVGEDPVMRMAHVPFSPEEDPGCWSWMFRGQGDRYQPDRKA